MKRVWLKIGVVLLAAICVLVASCEVADIEVEEKSEPVLISAVTVEVSPPKPFYGIVMPASMGHGWHRRPPEKNWELEWVAFDIKSFIPQPVHLDKAIVEVAGKMEEVPLDMELHYKEYKEQTLRLQSIGDIPSGEYELKVSLWSGEQLLCFKSDIARVYWKEP